MRGVIFSVMGLRTHSNQGMKGCLIGVREELDLATASTTEEELDAGALLFIQNEYLPRQRHIVQHGHLPRWHIAENVAQEEAKLAPGTRRFFRGEYDDRLGGGRRRTPTPEPTEDDRDKRTIFVQQISQRAETRHLRQFLEHIGPVVEAQIAKWERGYGMSRLVGAS